MFNPTSVLNSIASTLNCRNNEIEHTLEARAKSAGLERSPIQRHNNPEPRLDTIRAWLKTPEASSVIKAAYEFYRDTAVPPPPHASDAQHRPDKERETRLPVSAVQRRASPWEHP